MWNGKYLRHQEWPYHFNLFSHCGWIFVVLDQDVQKVLISCFNDINLQSNNTNLHGWKVSQIVPTSTRIISWFCHTDVAAFAVFGLTPSPVRQLLSISPCAIRMGGTGSPIGSLPCIIHKNVLHTRKGVPNFAKDRKCGITLVLCSAGLDESSWSCNKLLCALSEFPCKTEQVTQIKN